MEQRRERQLLGDLHVLVELARTGTVTAAADQLGIPQPTASRALLRLRELVGVDLVKRDGRKLVLTDAGRALARSSGEALEEIQGAIVDVRRQEVAPDAVVTIAYQTLLGESFLPRAIARFRGRHRGVRFRLTHGARARCIQLVLAGEYELAVVADPPDVPDLQRVTLFTEPILAVVSPRHPLAELGRAVTPAEIASHDLIILGRGYGLYDSIRRILGSAHTPGHAFEVDDYRIARGLASEGAGVTILPPSAAIADDDVVELEIDHPAASRTIAVLTANDPDPTIEAMMDALHATARFRW